MAIINIDNKPTDLVLLTAKTMHPDGGGSAEQFAKLKKAADAAVKWMTDREGGV